MERAYEELNRFSWNEQEPFTYEQSQKHEWDHNAIMDQKFDEGHEKGKIEGKIEVAKKLLASGMEIEIVASVTSLSIQEIKNLLP